MREPGFQIADLTRIAVFAALIAVLGIMPPVPVPGIPVPITAQTLGVMLAGAVLGPLRGPAAVAIFLMLVAAGMPLLSGGRGGAAIFMGTSGGYLIGWLFGAFAVGLLLRAGASRPVWWRSLIAAIAGGIIVIYAFGIPWQAYASGISISEAFLASLVFIPGDLAKAIITTIITLGLWRGYPRAFSWSTHERGASATQETDGG